MKEGRKEEGRKEVKEFKKTKSEGMVGGRTEGKDGRGGMKGGRHERKKGTE